jgi:hypothetical protein
LYIGKRKRSQIGHKRSQICHLFWDGGLIYKKEIIYILILS